MLGTLVDLQLTAHRNAGAPSKIAEMVELIKRSWLPSRATQTILRRASPLWLMSDPASVLAGDLALCHPKLKRNEVRAVVRPIEGTSSVRLTIVTADRKGLLADSAAVLASHRLSITYASAATWPRQDVALHSLTVSHGSRLDSCDWDAVGEDLQKMVTGAKKPILDVRPVGPLRVAVRGTGAGRSLLEVTARDQIGLLATLCSWLTELDTNIESLHARTVDGVAHDTFLVAGDLDQELLVARATRQSRRAGGSGEGTATPP